MTRAAILSTAALSLTLALTACGGGGGGDGGTAPAPAAPEPPPTLSTGPDECVAGEAGGFACSGVSLAARVPIAGMGGNAGNDIWGWADPQTGAEYALMGLTNGTAFVDVTDPEAPVFLGRLPTETFNSTWRDIKVHDGHALIVADAAGAHGMQVFDLTRLRGVTAPQTYAADNVYVDIGSAHNLAIDEESGFAYAVGAEGPGGCDHGLHMIDVRTPVNPMFAGCHTAVDTHDTQCVVYRGPDAEHAGSQVCFGSANLESADPAAPADGIARLEIVDVSLKSSPLQLSLTAYPESGYAHQGWLTEDHRYFLLGDETDESRRGVPTRTHVFDVSDLDAPRFLFAYEAPTRSIDHNLYVRGSRVYQANYTSGLRILEFGDLAAGGLQEIAYFDTYPDNDAVDFSGAWSVYPWLPSGNVLVSDQQYGLFVLTPD